MSRTNIILTGFMGCGKTTVGSLLAQKLNYDFIDTDQLIEERSSMTVQEIFATKGEKAFRDMESALARELGEGEGMVVATGGGLMLNPENVTALNANGQVFCLVATPAEILKRISSGKNNRRPLLETSDPMARIIELIQEREKSYSRFIQVNTSGRSPKEITEHLIAIFQSLQVRR
jgi:shikimate kinase